MNIGIIGGGAAGFFAAIHASGDGRHVTIFEKSPKLLSKVKVSGGGRCNVTHRPMEISKLVKNYPRGEKFLKRVFTKYKSEDTINWFESRGVALKIEADGRMFPVSDSSQSIIDALLKEAQKLNISVRKSCGVNSISPIASKYQLDTDEGIFLVDKLIVATGGHPKLGGYLFLKNLNHSVLDPIPSLFTFNTPKESIRELMGLSVADGIVKIEGTKLTYRGPVLVTHWGVSGPAVLKLSAFGAQWLKDQNYVATALINWNGGLGEEQYSSHIKSYMVAHPNRKVESNSLFDIPGRLWEHFCVRSGIDFGQLYGTLLKKQINKLVQNLFCYTLKVEGKTTFKEEFVTAGGIALNEVNPESLESKYHPNLYFAGEVLNIDGITGGFNFQAAWSTGFLAGTASFN
ncbi:NAD(P)/FAD-dependent oxidoreductase [Algoriphagus sp. D3-2-R+10]|uniref:NAD(P)/FAD-dependent oxidoreductase n=1 Tax=Algoriphagus aurantiacus TaxID=3103948 RepID=UPI002B3C7935|nr:NAD(P)/FAD-dependent oxidoreductase [Algoriphagus sp. D3-2-R+10]MEB2774264.1 NAD(P)/FAD-dependent oxidoreductase [Algoriphagus sp. D3-2-R+10]